MDTSSTGLPRNEPIRFEPLGIDEQDVARCTDLDQLTDWKLAVERNLLETKNRILSLKAIAEPTRNTHLQRTRAEKYRQLIAHFHQCLLSRISQLKREQKTQLLQQETRQRPSLDACFRQVAREMLTGQQYTAIILEAKARLQGDDDASASPTP